MEVEGGPPVTPDGEIDFGEGGMFYRICGHPDRHGLGDLWSLSSGNQTFHVTRLHDDLGPVEWQEADHPHWRICLTKTGGPDAD